MRNKALLILVCIMMAMTVLVGCGSNKESDSSSSSEATTTTEATKASSESSLEDGEYTAEFETDSNMFHVNEANDGKGTLTVKNGEMTIHVTLASKHIVNLFVGKAKDAKKSGADLLEPTTDKVKYSDGYEEEAYGFDIPVPAIDQEFDVALVGTKGTWYDHKVKVTNPEKAE